MYLNSDLMLALAKEHHRDLIADADRHRLLAAARRWLRKERDHGHKPAPREPARAAGNLAACGPREAAPAR